MKITKEIYFKNFKKKKNDNKILNLLNKLLLEDNSILKSFKESYKDSYKKNIILKLKKYSNINLIGMGGSILGSKAIFSFFLKKIKKNFYFIDNFELSKFNYKNRKKQLNLIVSKSGDTLETISSSNVIVSKSQKNIFITENKKSYLMNLAKKLKSEIVYHNNFIGGRYSVLSEVGMLPAQLMGLNPNKFRRFNFLINNKKFINALVQNVSNTLYLIKINLLNYHRNLKLQN